MTVTVVIGIGLASVSGGTGIELRARWQAAEDMALGIGLGSAWGDGDPDETVQTTRILGLRLFGAANPLGANEVALDFGAGVSTVNTGLWSFSLDAGAVTSVIIADTIEPSVGVAAAMAVPLVQGRPFGARGKPALPTTTFYLGGSFGLAAHLGSTRNTLSGETGAFVSRSVSGEQTTALYLSAGDSQSTRP